MRLTDYTEDGFFLKSLVIAKVIDNKVWRFFSGRKPYKLESFTWMGKSELLLSPETIIQSLANKFNFAEDKRLTAFRLIQKQQKICASIPTNDLLGQELRQV